jgi:hypothetical protein
MIAFRTGFALISLVGLADCGDPKTANETNFTKAIDDYEATQKACLPLPRGTGNPPVKLEGTSNFPIYIEMSADQRADVAKKINSEVLKTVTPYLEAGLLASTEADFDVRDTYNWGGPQKMRKAHFMSLSLTEKGKTVYKEPENRYYGGSMCYGTPAVIAIANFTEPGDRMGIKMSQVNYTWHLEDVAPWAKTPAFQEAFPVLQELLKDKRDGKALVVLTSKGWMHEKAANL